MHRTTNPKLLAAKLLLAVLASLGLMGMVSDAQAAPRDSKESRWAETISDKAIVEAVGREVEDLPATLVPGLEKYPEDEQKEARSAKRRLWHKPIEVGQQTNLLAVLSIDFSTAQAASQCKLAVVLQNESAKKPARVTAKQTFCWGGRTEEKLTQSVFRLTRDLPLLMSRQDSWTGDGNRTTYRFWRIDRGKFEVVLTFSTFEPMGHDKLSSERCTTPFLRTPMLPGEWSSAPSVPGIKDGPEPNALTATWVCRDKDTGGITQVRTRIWTWSGSKYTEATAAKLTDFPPQMGGPEKETD